MSVYKDFLSDENMKFTFDILQLYIDACVSRMSTGKLSDTNLRKQM